MYSLKIGRRSSASSTAADRRVQLAGRHAHPRRGRSVRARRPSPIPATRRGPDPSARRSGSPCRRSPRSSRPRPRPPARRAPAASAHAAWASSQSTAITATAVAVPAHVLGGRVARRDRAGEHQPHPAVDQQGAVEPGAGPPVALVDPEAESRRPGRAARLDGVLDVELRIRDRLHAVVRRGHRFPLSVRLVAPVWAGPNRRLMLCPPNANEFERAQRTGPATGRAPYVIQLAGRIGSFEVERRRQRAVCDGHCGDRGLNGPGRAEQVPGGALDRADRRLVVAEHGVQRDRFGEVAELRGRCRAR